MPGFDLETAAAVWRLGVALAVGLIAGSEREQRKGEGPGRAVGTAAVLAARTGKQPCSDLGVAGTRGAFLLG